MAPFPDQHAPDIPSGHALCRLLRNEYSFPARDILKLHVWPVAETKPGLYRCTLRAQPIIKTATSIHLPPVVVKSSGVSP